MKRAKLTIALAFLSFAFFPAYSQRNNQGEWKRYNFPKAWADYLYRTKADRSVLRENYYHDTVSVEEMRMAFEQYKDTIFKTSPYAGYDSINTYYGKLLVLRSPLKDVPMKEIWMKQRKSKYAKKSQETLSSCKSHIATWVTSCPQTRFWKHVLKVVY